MKFSKIILAISFIVISFATQAQVGIGTNSPATSAKLEVSSTTQGFLPPRMTEAQRNLISTPAQGLIIYCTDCGNNGEPEYYNGAAWKNFMGDAAVAAQVPLNENFGSTVTIGTQLWSATNLNVTTYRNGDVIPEVTDAATWTSLTTGAWCYYDNNSSNRKLYNWYALTDPRGLAPLGWHIPTLVEWGTLRTTLGAQAGTQMKSATGWSTPNANYNTSAFNAFPNGMRDNDGVFFQSGVSDRLWSNTEVNGQNDRGWNVYLFEYSNDLNDGQSLKYYGLSVRCIKD